MVGEVLKNKGDFMGNRIKDFTIIMQDAWSHTYLYSQLEEKIDGTFVINACYGDEVHSIKIADQSTFINNLKDLRIKDMDNVYYNWLTEDAFRWGLRIKYDNKEIISAGVGTIPKKFKKLVSLLGYDLTDYPVAEKDSWDWKREKMTCGRRLQSYLMLKECSGVREDIWTEPEHDYQVLSFKSDNYGRYKIGVNGNLKGLDSFYD